MTDFKVTDEAVRVAIDAFTNVPTSINSDEAAEELMRAAIEAALPVMFEQWLSGTWPPFWIKNDNAATPQPDSADQENSNG